MNKVYVDVVAEFSKDGQLVPILFIWEDGRKYKIDRMFEDRTMRQQKGRRCRNDVHLYGTGEGKPLVL